MCTCIELKKCDDSRSMDFVLVVGLLIISADLVHRLKSWKTVSPGNTV